RTRTDAIRAETRFRRYEAGPAPRVWARTTIHLRADFATAIGHLSGTRGPAARRRPRHVARTTSHLWHRHRQAWPAAGSNFRPGSARLSSLPQTVPVRTHWLRRRPTR